MMETGSIFRVEVILHLLAEEGFRGLSVEFLQEGQSPQMITWCFFWCSEFSPGFLTQH